MHSSSTIINIAYLQKGLHYNKVTKDNLEVKKSFKRNSKNLRLSLFYNKGLVNYTKPVR